MIKVYSLTSFIINFNLNETNDVFDEILELERDENQNQLQEKINIKIPIETWEFFDQIKKNLYKILIYYFELISFKALLVAFLNLRFKKLKFVLQEQREVQRMNYIKSMML